MPNIIHKKILPGYYDQIISGKKKFELRLGDFDASEGDILVLEEWDPKVKEYTGRKIEKVITSIHKLKINQTFWPREEIEKKGLQIFSIEWIRFY